MNESRFKGESRSWSLVGRARPLTPLVGPLVGPLVVTLVVSLAVPLVVPLGITREDRKGATHA